MSQKSDFAAKEALRAQNADAARVQRAALRSAPPTVRPTIYTPPAGPMGATPNLNIAQGVQAGVDASVERGADVRANALRQPAPQAGARWAPDARTAGGGSSVPRPPPPLSATPATPAAAAAQPAGPSTLRGRAWEGAKNLGSKTVSGAKNVAMSPIRNAGALTKGLGKAGAGGLLVEGAFGSVLNASQGNEIEDVFEGVPQSQGGRIGRDSPMRAKLLDNNPMLREAAELPLTAINVMADTGKNVANTGIGLANKGLGVFGMTEIPRIGEMNEREKYAAGLPQQADVRPMAAGAAEANPLAEQIAASQAEAQKRAEIAARVGVDPMGQNATRPLDEVVGNFGPAGTGNQRPITQREALRLAGQHGGTPPDGAGAAYMANLSKPEIMDFGGASRDNRGEINSQFDAARKEINSLHDGARMHARGEQGDKLLRLAEARAQALGQDFGSVTSNENQRSAARTALRGQDIDMDKERMKNQVDMAKAGVEAQTEQAKLKQQMGKESYDRNRQRINDTLAVDKDGKPTNPYGLAPSEMFAALAREPMVQDPATGEQINFLEADDVTQQRLLPSMALTIAERKNIGGTGGLASQDDEIAQLTGKVIDEDAGPLGGLNSLFNGNSVSSVLGHSLKPWKSDELVETSNGEYRYRDDIVNTADGEARFEAKKKALRGNR